MLDGRGIDSARSVHARGDSAVANSPSLPSTGDHSRESSMPADVADIFDRYFHFALSRWTMGLSPMILPQAVFEWLIHLGASPGTLLKLCQRGYANLVSLTPGHPLASVVMNDRRFGSADWSAWPFNLIAGGFLLQERWWSESLQVRGLDAHRARVLDFVFRQLLDAVSPSNFLFTNPEVLKVTFSEGGANLVWGCLNLLEDTARIVAGSPAKGIERFKVGENIAATPGKVVFRNALIELIQYEPTTAEVCREPILIVPAWIMKFYILDLSRQNSLVRYLVDQGFTVFIISWKNPGTSDRDLGMEDYRILGPAAALDAINALCPNAKVHAAGYCLGGTLLAATAAAMARDDDHRLATLSLFGAQIDFTEAGELTLFVDESQVAFLEDVMWERGYLEASEMAGAFQLLRSNDLIWSRITREYLLGRRQDVFDLLAWNADSTRMPYRMHSEYLRRLFLNNDLAEGRYLAGDRPVALTDIGAPVFAVATETDHVSPWRSVFKVNLLLDTDVTFLLTNGGHNAGIVSPPGVPGRHYRIATKREPDRYSDPATWMASAPEQAGSWWPEWSKWLRHRSDGVLAARPLPAVTVRAPGTYVLD